MYRVQNITDDAKQKQTLILPDGTQLSLTMYYLETQLGWFIMELTYGDFTAKGIRITNSPNILHQFRNRIPFGMACFSADDREPTLKEDFFSGASKLYILSEDEVDEYAEMLSE